MTWEGCFEDWKANMEEQCVASSGNYSVGVTCKYNNFVNAVCCWN